MCTDLRLEDIPSSLSLRPSSQILVLGSMIWWGYRKILENVHLRSYLSSIRHQYEYWTVNRDHDDEWTVHDGAQLFRQHGAHGNHPRDNFLWGW